MSTEIPDLGDESAGGSSHRWTQLVFTVTAICCLLIFWLAARVLGIPVEPMHGGSLLRQPIWTAIGALLAALVLVQCLALFTTALLAGRWMFAGLAATCVGLSAWSMRGGPMRDVLLYADSSRVFLTLAIELVLLGAIVGAAWLLLWRAYRESAPLEIGTERRPGWAQVGIQTVVMIIAVMVIAQTDLKKQALAAVFLGGWVSTAVAESFATETDAGKWYWVGPIAAGVFGYLMNWMGGGGFAEGLRTPGGIFAALARPLPLDYASAGIFGALIGYWTSQPEGEAEESVTESAQAGS